MKKLLLVVVFSTITFLISAQNDVTKFMGIPVDGYKHEMIQKLKEKGFVSNPFDANMLEGEFNGHSVYVSIATYNNKVRRVGVVDKNNVSEADIRIRFNQLCKQFANNPNYIYFSDYTIPEDEDISYGMTVNNKRYQATFYQRPNIELLDSAAVVKVIMERLSHKYTEEQLDNPSEETAADISQFATDYVFELIEKKSVWFMINEMFGKYYIMLYYDNKYNEANGNDL